MSAQDTETHVGAAGKTLSHHASPWDEPTPRKTRQGVRNRWRSAREKGVGVWQDLPQRLMLRRRRELQPKAAAGHTSAAFAPTARARQPYFKQVCIIYIGLGLVPSRPPAFGVEQLASTPNATRHGARQLGNKELDAASRRGVAWTTRCTTCTCRQAARIL